MLHQQRIRPLTSLFKSLICGGSVLLPLKMIKMQSMPHFRLHLKLVSKKDLAPKCRLVAHEGRSLLVAFLPLDKWSPFQIELLLDAHQERHARKTISFTACPFNCCCQIRVLKIMQTIRGFIFSYMIKLLNNLSEPEMLKISTAGYLQWADSEPEINVSPSHQLFKILHFPKPIIC